MHVHSVATTAAVSGKDYLLRKRQQEQALRTAQEQGQREAATVEAALAGQADLACRVRILPASLTSCAMPTSEKSRPPRYV